MKPALATLLPMFAAAGLVLFGGERLAKRESEERITADRERLLDFASAFGRELDRLEQRYLGHLDSLADAFVRGQPAPEEQARDLTGIAAAHLFTSAFSPSVTPRKDEFSPARPGRDAPRLPEVELEGAKSPLDPQKAVILPKGLLDENGGAGHGWIAAPGGAYQVYWHRPDTVRLVALVVSEAELRGVTDTYLQSWMAEPAAHQPRPQRRSRR